MAAATPIGSSDGYTLFVRGDAVLANSELEGALAVGGTARFGDPRGNQNLQYPVFHGGVGGNADYAAPTVGGVPNRLLIQRFSSNKIVQVQGRGATGSNVAGAKIGDPSLPAGYVFRPQFGGPGTTFSPADGDNQSPQLESAVQPWTTPSAAQASWGITGDVLSHFPADTGASTIASFTGWRTIAPPPPSDDQVITLDPAGPSRLPLSAFGGISKFQLAGYSEISFLVISVSPADVVDGRVTLPSYASRGAQSPQNAGISHILFDLSAISGDVTVTSPNEPVRGAIYAPKAHIIFPPEADGGREFEGQLIAGSLTALAGGKEMHTNLFSGRFPCTTPDRAQGTFSLRKVLSGVDAGAFPAGTVFPVTATWDGGEKSFDLPADGAVLPSGVALPEGTVVSLTEGALPAAPDGYSFVSKSLSAPSITILAGGDANVAWSVTNTYAKDVTAKTTGGFDLQKQLAGVAAGGIPAGTVFTVTASWTIDGVTASRDYALPADGTRVTGARDLPVGTVVTFGEVDVPRLDGYTFSRVEFSPTTLTIQAGGTAVVTAVNTYVKVGASLPATGGTVPTVLAGLGVLLVLAGASALVLRVRRSAA